MATQDVVVAVSSFLLKFSYVDYFLAGVTDARVFTES